MSLSMSMVNSPDDTTFVDAVEDLNETSNALIGDGQNNADVAELTEGISNGLSINETSSPAPSHEQDSGPILSPTPGLMPATPSTEMTAATRKGGGSEAGGSAERWRHSPTGRPSPIGTAPELQRSDPAPPSPKPHSSDKKTTGNDAGCPYDEGETAVRPSYSAEEIDAILDQLNVLESDYESQVATLKEDLRTKETILRALSDQISESQNRNEALIEKVTEQSKAEDRLREEAALGSGVIRELRDELIRMEDEHERILLEQRRHWEGEVMKAEEAVKAEAERQFADANECFLRLQAEHETVKSERDALAEEAHKAAALAAREERKAKGRETELLAESAELRAALAAAEAQVAVEKRARVEVTRSSEEREVEARDELTASRNECLAMQHSLAAVVAEKEKVSAENRELSKLCEELMAIVEGGGEGANS